jgi:hypothetical protein
MPSLYDRFNLVSDFSLAGDQERAIGELVDGLERGDRHQVLLGVTGSGKTFTMAQTIARVNRPTLVMVHNKTLAAQLFQEFRRFFPENAVEYFVSYYDYYQPEAYVPATDSYIEKEAIINEEIDRLRGDDTKRHRAHNDPFMREIRTLGRADLHDADWNWVSGERTRGSKQGGHAVPALGHGCSRCLSHARAVAQSRSTVLGSTPMASATSGTLMPAK